jgi:hypothetical protein
MASWASVVADVGWVAESGAGSLISRVIQAHGETSGWHA